MNGPFVSILQWIPPDFAIDPAGEGLLASSKALSVAP